VKLGVDHGLRYLLSPATYRRNPRLARELADSSTLVGQRWAKQYASQLGAGLGAPSADGLLVSMAALQRRTWSEDIVWRTLRSVVGLPPGQALSVLQIAQNRLETALGSRRPMTAKDFGADVGRVLLSRRARAIRANESEVARNFGTLLVLMNAQSKGYLPEEARKVWVTAVDERVCPVCAPMDSVAVKVAEPFLLRAHRGVLQHDARLWVPPAHPNCRCRIVPESAIGHGIITSTARFSRNEAGRARLKSRLADLVDEARPGWMGG
jgi:hypothetical protein